MIMALELVPKEAVSSASKQGALQEENPTYSGIERRREQRRITVDRREMIRFDASERRSGGERRASLGLWKNREF
jgi:hypothetical protein